MLAGFYESIAQKGLDSPYEADIQAYAEGDMTLVWLTKALISRESGWDPNAYRAEPQINDASIGLMQILMGTANLYQPVTVDELFDPTNNIGIGMAHLRMLRRQYATLGDVISAYNAGRPITGNQPYVDDVLTYYVFYLNNEPGEVQVAEQQQALEDVTQEAITMNLTNTYAAATGQPVVGTGMGWLVAAGLVAVVLVGNR